MCCGLGCFFPLFSLFLSQAAPPASRRQIPTCQLQGQCLVFSLWCFAPAEDGGWRRGGPGWWQRSRPAGSAKGRLERHGQRLPPVCSVPGFPRGTSWDTGGGATRCGATTRCPPAAWTLSLLPLGWQLGLRAVPRHRVEQRRGILL